MPDTTTQSCQPAANLENDPLSVAHAHASYNGSPTHLDKEVLGFIDEAAKGRYRVFFNPNDFIELFQRQKCTYYVELYTKVSLIKKGWRGETDTGSYVGSSRQVPQGSVLLAPATYTASELNNCEEVPLPSSLTSVTKEDRSTARDQRTFESTKRLYAIWWLTQTDLEFLRSSETVIKNTLEPEQPGIWKALRSMSGRSGRGRLWNDIVEAVNPASSEHLREALQVQEASFQESFFGQFLGQHCGGLIIKHSPQTIAKIIRLFPGTVTNFKLTRLYTVCQDEPIEGRYPQKVVQARERPEWW